MAEKIWTATERTALTVAVVGILGLLLYNPKAGVVTLALAGGIFLVYFLKR
jgi:hypothetical protein